MKKWIGLAVALTLAAGLAFGKSSEENRGDSLLYVGITPGLLLHPPSLLSQPVGVAVYLGKSLVLGGEFGSNSATQDNNGDVATVSYTNMGVVLRWFPGNSFNFLLAAHQRTWDGRANVNISNGLGGTIPVGMSMQAQTTVGSLGIGNQWMADFGLTWGFDWFVLSGPLSSTTRFAIDASALGGLGATQIAEAETRGNDMLKVLNLVSVFPGLFVFNLGWSF